MNRKDSIISYNISFKTICFKDLLDGEDDGGLWTFEDHEDQNGDYTTTLTNTDLQVTATGITDNPCLDLSDFGCGRYLMNYEYESSTCDGCKMSTKFYVNIPCGAGEGDCEKVSCNIQPNENQLCGGYTITGTSPNGPVTFEITLPDGSQLIANGPSYDFTSAEGVIVAIVMDELGCMPTCSFLATESACNLSSPIVQCGIKI